MRPLRPRTRSIAPALVVLVVLGGGGCAFWFGLQAFRAKAAEQAEAADAAPKTAAVAEVPSTLPAIAVLRSSAGEVGRATRVLQTLADLRLFLTFMGAVALTGREFSVTVVAAIEAAGGRSVPLSVVGLAPVVLVTDPAHPVERHSGDETSGGADGAVVFMSSVELSSRARFVVVDGGCCGDGGSAERSPPRTDGPATARASAMSTTRLTSVCSPAFQRSSPSPRRSSASWSTGSCATAGPRPFPRWRRSAAWSCRR